ncbi:MAG: riboflavin synthase [Pseudomonadota bacterium]
MFTGIITDVGRLESLEQREGGDTRLRIATRYDLAEVALGASIACGGACLTVVEREGAPSHGDFKGVFAVDVSAETLSKTTLGDWIAGRAINLERALKIGDELGGHIVSGHVDAVGAVSATRPEGDSTRVEIRAPRALAPFVAPKGSIAIDGCSLTVNEVTDEADAVVFGINLIPHTKRWTSFEALAPGVRVNLEIDMLARYVSRLQAAMAPASAE